MKEMTFTEFQRKAGMAGTGKSKRRTKAHYVRMAKLSAESRRAKKEQK